MRYFVDSWGLKISTNDYATILLCFSPQKCDTFLFLYGLFRRRDVIEKRERKKTFSTSFLHLFTLYEVTIEKKIIIT